MSYLEMCQIDFLILSLTKYFNGLFIYVKDSKDSEKVDEWGS